MSEISIKIKEKIYKNKSNGLDILALKNIDIKIKSKEFLCVVGPSGCGKTTLMNIIGGLVKCEQQEILVNQKVLSEKNSLGYIFQTSRLLPWLTVFENVKLVCQNNEDYDQKILRILKNFGLNDFINAFPNTISGGMRRRVSIARAFINSPDVLLMDEPFISLDQPASEDLYSVLINYWKKKPTTVILITHSLREALLLGDRILFMSNRPGKVILDYSVKSSRQKLKIDCKEVEKEYLFLNKQHPTILKGVL